MKFGIPVLRILFGSIGGILSICFYIWYRHALASMFVPTSSVGVGM